MTRKVRSLVDEAMRQLYFKSWREACIVTDHDLRILEFTGDLARYGLEDVAVGDDASERLDFAVGVQPGVSMCLPVVVMPNGELSEVYIDTWDGFIVIVLYLAASEQRYYFELQRRNSEVRLLIERQKRLVRSLIQARQELKSRSAELESLNDLKSRFIARMSHEFRTPLTSILGYTQLLDHERQLDAEGHAWLKSVDRAARHLLGMVESILDQARIEAGELSVDLKATDLRSVFHGLDTLFLPIANERGLQFDIDGVDTLPSLLEVDEMRLRQTLVNLISNALKYTPEGRVRVTACWDSGWLDVRVRDTGPGIPEHERERAFTPFQRLTESEGIAGGTGLGLSITRSLTDLMGGTLALESESPWGAVFRVRVPAAEIDADPDQDTETGTASLETVQPRGAGEAILIVEDDDDIARLLCVVLAEAGYDPRRARNGSEALVIAAGEAFALVLMDMNMPVMDGGEATRCLRDRGFAGPVIGVSASVAASDRANAMAAGCDDYLAKPIDLGQLISSFDRWLSATRGAGGGSQAAESTNKEEVLDGP